MKHKWKKLIVLSLIACMLGILLTGCASVPAAGNEVNVPTKLDMTEPITDDADMETPTQDSANDSTDTENISETPGKWHVYDPDVAAAVGADFEGVVHKIDADFFFIYPMETELMEDGTLSCSSFAPGVEISDEELVKVVFDSDTVFTLRDIYDSGKRYEDSEASFQSIENGCSVALKGKFQNDVFYANLIRITKVH